MISLLGSLSRLKRPSRLQKAIHGWTRVPAAEWRKALPKRYVTKGHGSCSSPSTPAYLTASLPPQVPDSGALSRACGLIQQLHVAYSTLASSLQGLPSELQQQVGRARHSLCELYSLVSSASSMDELPAERLAQSRGAVGRAWRELEQMLESVQHGPPLCWLVGPFALCPAGQQL